MRTLLLGVLLLISTIASAQGGDASSSEIIPLPTQKVVRKIQVRHADPKFIMLLLAGRNPSTPEIIRP